MRFSEVFSIEPSQNDDWFDTIPTQDSPLYIDPYLVFEDKDAFWSGAYDSVVEFFELATELVLKSGGEEDTPAWRKAERLLHFPEPKEFALGLSMLGPDGAGTGKDFAHRIAGVLKLVGKTGVENLAAIAGFALFTDGLGRDRTSDILCNILKSQFISYTELVAKRHSLKTEEFTVRHADWDRSKGAWADVKHQLPASPTGRGPVLLTPKRFLKDIPQVTPERVLELGGARRVQCFTR